ncbi:MAG: IS200/IS605 family transposase [Caldilinea sp. CFX5]|nr:IS200/IS605 family transposase [Caldilinea sp. CFX5]
MGKEKRMAYWRLCYHFVWTTKDRQPWITPKIERPLYRWLYNEAKKMYCPFFYIGGMPEHVHVVTAVRPSVAPSDFMHQLKGSSSWFITQEFHLPFYWQEGYGVFSVSDSLIDTVKAYVLRQKSHHAGQELIPEWEESHEWNLGPATVDQSHDDFLQEAQHQHANKR